MNRARRICFVVDEDDPKTTIAYFLQEGPRTCNAACSGCYAGAGAETGPRGVVPPDVAKRDVEALRAHYRVLICRGRLTHDRIPWRAN